MAGSGRDVTILLHDLAAGDAAALDRLLPLVYDELRRLAQQRLRYERDGHTLDTVALVHEAYERMVDQTRAQWRDRGHFYAVAAQTMRRVLVDWARARHAQKRGGHDTAISLGDLVSEPADLSPERPETLLALDAALTRLANRSERQARVVECRYFAGLSLEETAEALGISLTTVKDDWKLARTWLFRELRDGAPD
jgi:RNA polymerase sigma factor (TIGR02999 family)